MKIKTLIIENDVDDRELLESALLKFSYVNIVQTCESYEEALKAIETHKPDLLFLDIRLGDRKGYELLKEARSKNSTFKVIVVTGSSNEYAQKAFDENLADCIQKPVSDSRIEIALEKVGKRISRFNLEKHFEELKLGLINAKRMAIREVGKTTIIRINDILYLEADGSVTIIRLKNGRRIVPSRNLGYFERILPSNLFCRIHARYLINLNCLDEYQQNERFVLLSGEIRLEVSRGRASNLHSSLDSYTI